MTEKEYDVKFTKSEIKILSDIVDKEFDAVLAKNISNIKNEVLNPFLQYKDDLDLVRDKLQYAYSEARGGKRKISSRKTRKVYRKH